MTTTVTHAPDRLTLGRILNADRVVTGALFVLAVLLLAAIFAGLIAPAPMGAATLTDRLLAPSGEHLFGTDDLGRDLFSQTLYGLQISLGIATASAVICGLIGAFLGAIAGWFGGRVDTLISFFIDVQSSIPAFILALGALVFFGGSPAALIIILSIEGWERFARIVRAQTMSIRRSGYVTAAVALGVPTGRVLARHLLPGVAGPLLVQFTLALPSKIVLESALSFLGLGIQPPETSLGQIVGAGRDYLTNAPWIALFPGALIVVISVVISLVGDRLQDRMIERE